MQSILQFLKECWDAMEDGALFTDAFVNGDDYE